MIQSPTGFSPAPRAGAPWALTAWDVREVARAAAFALLVLVLGWLITAATDEGGVAWSERAARVLPLAPAAAALGTWLGQARGWARGEGRALATLGRAPLVSSAPAVIGGAAVAWAAALSMALVSRVDVTGFFPVAHAPSSFVVEAGGEFLDESTGQRIHADGTLSPAGPATSSTSSWAPVPPYGRAAAALATGLFGLALPLLVAKAARGSRLEKAGVVVAAGIATVFLFQAAAVRMTVALAAVIPAIVLLGWAGARVREGTRRRS